MILSLILSLWLPAWQSFRIVFGIFYILFLPGFIWSWFFWEKNQINIPERLALSIVISIGIVPVIVFLLDKLEVKISVYNTLIEITCIIALGGLALLLKRKGVFNKFFNKKQI